MHVRTDKMLQRQNALGTGLDALPIAASVCLQQLAAIGVT